MIDEIRKALAEVDTRQDPPPLDDDRPLADQGFDSLALADLACSLDEYGVQLEMGDLTADMSIKDISRIATNLVDK